MEYHIDCIGIDTPKQLHRILAETLAFPEWYGNNLDALYDCLTDISEKTILILANWTDATPSLRSFRRTMTDADLENSNFTVIFE